MSTRRFGQTGSLEEPLIGVCVAVAALTIGFFLPLVIGLKSVEGSRSGPKAETAIAPREGAVVYTPGKAPDLLGSGAPPTAVVVGGMAVPDVASANFGERVYAAYCIACHQAGGAGKVGFAPSIRNHDFLALASDDFLRDSIVGGRPGTAMVPWAHLKPVEIDSLVAYLRAAEDPQRAGNPKADPSKKYAGDASPGKNLYGTYCAACHGPNAAGYAEGGAGPAIGNSGFLAVASDDFIFQTAKHGRVGTQMRGFSGAGGLANLSDEEIGHVIAYLRSSKDAAPTVAAGPGDPKAGHLHYNANCAACHQADGTGLVGFAPSIRNRDFLGIANDQFIKDTIRNGRLGTAMVQRPDLSDQVLNDIVAYLRALPGGPTKDIQVDPTKDLASMGDAEKGHAMYGSFCASCHGEDGKGYVAGGPGSAIGLSGFLNSASDDFIFQTLKQGRVGTPMRPFIGARGLANLSEQDAYDIIAYLRNLNKPSNSSE